MRRTSKYLGVFILPRAQKEHAQLKAAIEHHSDGDCKMAFSWAGPAPERSAVIAYLFTSGTHPKDMGFGQVILNQDSFLIVEIGEAFSEKDLSVAAHWLFQHKAQRG